MTFIVLTTRALALMRVRPWRNLAADTSLHERASHCCTHVPVKVGVIRKHIGAPAGLALQSTVGAWLALHVHVQSIRFGRQDPQPPLFQSSDCRHHGLTHFDPSHVMAAMYMCIFASMHSTFTSELLGIHAASVS